MVPATADDPIRAAENGTLFLDGVGCLSLHTQRALLVFLLRFTGATSEEGERPWAGRLVTGHAESLNDAVRAGRFLPQLCDALDKVRVQLAGEMEAHVA